MSFLVLEEKDLYKRPFLFPLFGPDPVDGGKGMTWRSILSMNKAVLWLIALFNVGLCFFAGFLYTFKISWAFFTNPHIYVFWQDALVYILGSVLLIIFTLNAVKLLICLLRGVL
jgi:hypothetical protein